MTSLGVIVVLLILLFGLTTFIGAPYIPTHKQDIERALDLLALTSGDILVDLGSGDGAVLKAAAARGVRAYGYEVNPLLCFVSWLRCRHFRELVRIFCRDFWSLKLPEHTKAVFIFAAGPYMKRLSRKFERETVRLGHELYVASYGFTLSASAELVKEQRGVYIYIFRPAVGSRR